MSVRQHFTTRRAFIGAMGFGGVALYGAWAGYGAAPLPFMHASDDDAHGAPPQEAAGGHGGHGGPGGMSAEEFLARHGEFVARFKQADGSVAPRVELARAGATPAAGQGDAHAGHGAAPAQPDPSAPIDVYLLAFRFGFDPDELRLEAGRSYRFRMMASDIAHGASLQLGPASRIIRVRPNAVTDQTITFQRPGSFLVYCTVFCGPAHDAMKARIVVA